jgi:hypothetical protein
LLPQIKDLSVASGLRIAATPTAPRKILEHGSFGQKFTRLNGDYPNGTTPPIHIPRLRLAATLSRMRLPMTSRSNWAKDSRMLR